MQFQDIFTWIRHLFIQYGYFGIFVASLSGALSIIVPVPDTIVVFTLAGLRVGGGARYYNPIKAFPPALVGKFLMSLMLARARMVAYGARFSIGVIADIFGVGSSLVSLLISLAIGIILSIAMFKVDWAKRYNIVHKGVKEL